MKKNALSLAVAAGVATIATVAQADMYINDKGLGEALVYPMYSAQNGNNTLIAIANTTGDAKAVKVRIIEGQNSQEVLDFNLYMSPEDHFSFAITATEDGGAQLVTTDNSCTVPAIPDADGDGVKSVAFRNTLLLGDKAKDDPDTDADESFDNTSIARTQIGYIEVIEMGQINPSATAVVDPKTGSGYVKKNVYSATKHNEQGLPADCSVVVAGWSDLGPVNGTWLAESASGSKGTSEFMSSWMGGGLYGYGTVLNVADGTAFGYDAVAIEGLVEQGQPGSALHYNPGDTRPDFTDAALSNSAIVELGGMAQTATYGLGLEVLAVGTLFQTQELMNDYVTDEAINAETDWVITMPTKTFHVQKTPTITPFSTVWNGRTACEPVVFDSWDREEAFVPDAAGGPDFSPRPPVQTTSNDLPLCFETNVISFSEESATNSEDVVLGVSSILDYENGWARISFDPALLDTKTIKGVPVIGSHQRVITPDSGPALQGLPVTGFAVVKYTNSSANEAGALANYAMSTEHKTMAAVSATTP